VGPLVAVAATALLVGCAPRPPGTLVSSRIGADPALRPQIDRFAAALARRLGVAHVPMDGPETTRFGNALGVIVASYVDPVDPARPVDAAIAGLAKAGADVPDLAAAVDAGITAMVGSVDRRGSYLTPALYRELQREGGELGGVGLELTTRDGPLTVVAPLEDGPAAHGGVRPRDRVLAIDGLATDGLSLVDAVRRLRGPIGSEVTLRIGRGATAQALDVRLRRRRIEIVSVRSERLVGGHGYVRIGQFGETVRGDVERALAAFEEDGGLPGLVLDLRNNAGGLLTSSVAVADVFLAAGSIVRTAGRAEKQTQTFVAHRDGGRTGFPMVVLVNGGTASGSEILAAALRDHGRARIAGAPTAGIGTIQTILPISGDAALRLTTARAFTPAGRPIDEPLQPDVPLEDDAGGPPSARDAIVAEAARLLGTPPLTDW
jgi:carboxyl-terminal processing protease